MVEMDRGVARILEFIADMLEKTNALGSVNTSAQGDVAWDIRLYLQLRDERKKETYRQRWLERQTYLWARHNDTPKNREVDDEKFHVDRISVKT